MVKINSNVILELDVQTHFCQSSHTSNHRLILILDGRQVGKLRQRMIQVSHPKSYGYSPTSRWGLGMAEDREVWLGDVGWAEISE